MAHSIYEIDGYQDMSKPSDAMSENYYLQDVFFQSRPEVFDYDDQTHDKNPAWIYNREDDSVKEQENSEFRYIHNPSNWDQQDPILKNPWKVNKGYLLARYRLATNPIDLSSFEKQAASPRWDKLKEKVHKFVQPWKEKFKKYKDKIFKPKKDEKELEVKPPEMKYKDIPRWDDKKETERGIITLENLLEATGNLSRKYAPNCTVQKIREDKKNHTWSFRVMGREKWSDPNGHVVFFRIDPRKPKNEPDIRKLKVLVSCDCDFWKWYGPDYHARTEKYLEGLPRSNGKRPEVNDPSGENKVCKHVIAVTEKLGAYAARRKIDTYKEVNSIIKTLTTDPKNEMKDFYKLIDLLDLSEKKKIYKFVLDYKKAKDADKKNKIREEALSEITPMLQNKDKDTLKKMLKVVNRIKNSNRVASEANVLKIYLENEENRDADL